jgi:DNA-binding GntR family transcriptional regulator
MGVKRETVGGQIANQLRQEILFGHLESGEVLSQEAMCERFETSRMPVRDAFQQLTHEGFLERFSGNRLRVTQLNRTDLLDMFWIEATVHALATKRATERHYQDVGSFDHLYEMQAQMLECADRGDYKTASTVNRSFHKAINYLAESPKLRSTLRNVSMGIQGNFIAEVPEWLGRSIVEHDEILRAMQRGDAERARELMFRHTEGSALKIVADIVGPVSPETVEVLQSYWPAYSVDFVDMVGVDRLEVEQRGHGT